MIGLGWNSSYSLMGGDGANLIWPFTNYIVEESGVWQKTLFRSQVLGGSKIQETFGSLLICQILSKLHLSTLWCLNVSVLFAQASFSFWGIKGLLQSGMFKEVDLFKRFLILLAIVWLFSFSPLIGWRIGFGHLNIIFGLLSFFTIFSFIQLSYQSLTSSLLAIFILVNGLPYFGFQIIIYSLIFATPLVLGFFGEKNSRRFNWNSFLITSLVILTSLLFIAPMLLGIFDNFLGDDSVRSVAGNSLIYSYTTATLGDWWSSLFWHQLIPLKRYHLFHHEVNYPWGPFLLMTIPLLKFRKWKVLLGFFISLTLSIIFSSNISPISNWLPELIPILKSFRVPARSQIPILLIWIYISLVTICESIKFKESMKPPMKYIIYTSWSILIFLIFTLGIFFREVTVWILILFVVYLLVKRKTISISNFSILFFTVGLISVFSFQERMPRFVKVKDYKIVADKIKLEVLEKRPVLKSPLERAIIFIDDFPSLNKQSFLGISTIEGFGLTSKRFSRLYQLLNNQNYNSTRMIYWFDFRKKDLTSFQQLYNVKYKIIYKNKKLKIKDYRLTPGPFWASVKVQYVKKFSDLKKVLPLLTNQNNWHETLVLLEKDIVLEENLFGNCNKIEFGKVEHIIKGQSFKVRVGNVKKNCPVTLSLNYVSNLRVRVRRKDILEEVKTFPSYGSLLSFVLPEEGDLFILDYKHIEPYWVKKTFYLGASLFLLILILIYKINKKKKADNSEKLIYTNQG